MKILGKYWIVLLLMQVVFACNNNKSIKNANNTVSAAVTNKNRTLVMPTPPPMLPDSISRTNYMVAHYWDNFDFNDTTLIHEPDIKDRAVLSFLYGAQLVDKEKAVAAIISVFKKAEAETTGRMYSYFVEKIGEFLYEPNSVVRNEEIYIPVTEYIINSNKSDLAERERAKYMLALMMKNRIGEIASDFEYILASGQSASMHELKAPYTLLYFYDPDCSGCANSIEFVKSSGTAIKRAIQSNKLKVLAFYPDNDIEQWRNHLEEMPAGWITGYDRERTVKSESMYDLKGTPAIYLLDENKRVIMKGVPMPVVESYLAGVAR